MDDLEAWHKVLVAIAVFVAALLCVAAVRACCKAIVGVGGDEESGNPQQPPAATKRQTMNKDRNASSFGLKSVILEAGIEETR